MAGSPALPVAELDVVCPCTLRVDCLFGVQKDATAGHRGLRYKTKTDFVDSLG